MSVGKCVGVYGGSEGEGMGGVGKVRGDGGEEVWGAGVGECMR